MVWLRKDDFVNSQQKRKDKKFIQKDWKDEN
jgi:hypothetical protein